MVYFFIESPPYVVGRRQKWYRNGMTNALGLNEGITILFSRVNGSFQSTVLYTVIPWHDNSVHPGTSLYSITFTFTSTTVDVYEPPADVRATCCSLAFIAYAHARFLQLSPRNATLIFRHYFRRAALLLPVYARTDRNTLWEIFYSSWIFIATFILYLFF